MFKNLSDNLNWLMSKARLNSSGLARLTGVPATTIKRIRNNEQSNPTLSTLLPVADYFAVSIDELLGCDLPGMPGVSSALFGRANALPLLGWQECVNFDVLDYAGIADRILTERQVGEKSYALKMEAGMQEFFPENSLLIVDPAQSPEPGDFVIVAKNGQGPASIKKYIVETGQVYLKSLIEGLGVVPLAADCRMLGVVVQYKVDLKWPGTGKKGL